MARIRTIKPEFFRHEELFEAERATKMPLRVAYAGLWTAADREGRFRWKPRQLKLDCLPFDEIDFSRVLDALETRGFIVKYECDGEVYGFIPSWASHQIINNRESSSILPAPEESAIKSNTSTRDQRVDDASVTPLKHASGEGKGKEGKGVRVEAARFEDFWSAWPKSERKQDKAKCMSKWATDALDNHADEILADIAVKKASSKWTDDGGKYIESPLVYLNNARWQDGAGSGEQPINPMFAGLI
jgi:hypothetical protein